MLCVYPLTTCIVCGAMSISPTISNTMIDNNGCHPLRACNALYVLYDGSIRRGVLNLFYMYVSSIQKFFEDMTPEERASYKQAKVDSLPVVVGKIDLPEVKVPCAHDWGGIHDDHNGVYRCKKCGKYSA